MGTFHYPIEVGDPQGQRWERLDALVDTGATYTTLPASLLRRLGVQAIERTTFTLADERTVERDLGIALVRIDGRLRPTVVVFSPGEGTFILGAVTLEEFSLGVDLVRKHLVRTTGLLM